MFGSIVLPQIGMSADGRVSEELCASAAMTADRLKVPFQEVIHAGVLHD